MPQASHRSPRSVIYSDNGGPFVKTEKWLHQLRKDEQLHGFLEEYDRMEIQPESHPVVGRTIWMANRSRQICHEQGYRGSFINLAQTQWSAAWCGNPGKSPPIELCRGRHWVANTETCNVPISVFKPTTGGGSIEDPGTRPKKTRQVPQNMQRPAMAPMPEGVLSHTKREAQFDPQSRKVPAQEWRCCHSEKRQQEPWHKATGHSAWNLPRKGRSHPSCTTQDCEWSTRTSSPVLIPTRADLQHHPKGRAFVLSLCQSLQGCTFQISMALERPRSDEQDFWCHIQNPTNWWSISPITGGPLQLVQTLSGTARSCPASSRQYSQYKQKCMLQLQRTYLMKPSSCAWVKLIQS